MQAQYRGYSQQQVPQRSPHAGNQRRGGIGKRGRDGPKLLSSSELICESAPGPMMPSGSHPTVSLTPGQITQQQQAQAHASEMAKRRSRKPTDRNLPDGVERCTIDPEVAQRYNDLREIEKKMDSTLTRKRLDIDTFRQPGKLQKTLRIWISNTVENQPWQSNGLNVDAFDFNSEMNASYCVKISARILDTNTETQAQLEEDISSDAISTAGRPTGSKVGTALEITTTLPRFSHFFKSLSVESDNSDARDGSDPIVEWKKPEHGSRRESATVVDFDDFTFNRNGDENKNVTIELSRHEVPERFELSPELADVVDMIEASQQEAVMGLWEYIRLYGLQEDEEKRNFRCDDLLRKIVKRGDVGSIPMLNEYVLQHLRPIPPIRLPYTIRVDEHFHTNPMPTIYDVQVSVDDPFRASLVPLANNPHYFSMLKEVNGLDEQIARLIQAISVSKAKHAFFESLSEDPANIIRSWLSSQKRDLDIIMGEAPRGSNSLLSGDEWRRGDQEGVWTTQNARESINVLLSKSR